MRLYWLGTNLLIFLSSLELTKSNQNLTDVEEIRKVSHIGRLLAAQIIEFSSLMLQANISSLCSAVVVFGSPRYCDCLQCLRAEADFRRKYCIFGELVRNSEEMQRIHTEVSKFSNIKELPRFLADDFYERYCDQKRCSNVPQRCCSPVTSNIPKNPFGCPLCFPVDGNYGTSCRVH